MNRLKLNCSLAILCLIAFSNICVGNQNQNSNRIELANSIVRFEFEPGNLGLAAMVDLNSDTDHFIPIDGKHSLWQLTLYNNDQKLTLSSAQLTCSSYKINELAAGLKQATLLWNDLDLNDEKNVLNVKVTVELPNNSGIASWRIHVNNDSKLWGLWQVDFPYCSGFLKSTEYDIAVPQANWGKLYRKFNTKMSYKYPFGWLMPMQFMCALNGNNAVYIATHDPGAWVKSFVIEPGKEFCITTNAENMAVPGSDFSAPFPVMMGVYQGNWMKACKTYRKFAVTAPWTAEGKLSQRSSVPQKLKDTALWMLVHNYIGPENGTLAEKNKPLLDAQKFFDVPLAAHWYNWHQIPFDTHYPNYFPTKPDIADQVHDLVSHGLVIMPYINGRIVDISNDDFNDSYLPYACKNRDGNHYTETYGNGVKQAPMCPYTEFWQNKVADIVERLGNDVGVNAVYIDQIAAAGPVLCFDKSHGHPLGGGRWWYDGYREMLKKVQQAAHAQGRNMIITTECAAEPCMDGLDAFLIWIKPDDRSIPMTTAVYSGYSLYFASPAWFQHGDRAWIAAQGRAFIWGSQCGWMGFELFQPEHAKKAAYLKKVGKYRVAARKFLTYGELVDTVKPTNKIETITETWPDHGGNARTATLPSIQGAIWKAQDNSFGLFLVNYLEKANTVEFDLDPANYSLTKKLSEFTATQIRPEGNINRNTISNHFSETLEPWEIRLLEIK